MLHRAMPAPNAFQSFADGAVTQSDGRIVVGELVGLADGRQLALEGRGPVRSAESSQIQGDGPRTRRQRGKAVLLTPASEVVPIRAVRAAGIGGLGLGHIRQRDSRELFQSRCWSSLHDRDNSGNVRSVLDARRPGRDASIRSAKHRADSILMLSSLEDSRPAPRPRSKE